MELFERIRYLSEIKGVSFAKIAKFLDVPQQTFHQWLKKGSQKNLWEHLPKILELYPDVRPEWLYMGQEPAFKDGTASTEPELTPEEALKLREENERLKSELAEADRLNRKLAARLLVGDNSEESVDNSEKAAG